MTRSGCVRLIVVFPRQTSDCAFRVRRLVPLFFRVPKTASGVGYFGRMELVFPVKLVRFSSPFALFITGVFDVDLVLGGVLRQQLNFDEYPLLISPMESAPVPQGFLDSSLH